MHMIDTHTHLFASEFNSDREQVVQRAIASGVKEMILPNININTIQSMMDLCADFPKNCYPMIGLHPCDVKENYLDELNIIKKWLKKGGFVGVGEIGIDLYWNKNTLDIQLKAFKKQIELAKEYKLPIAIHVRDSFNEVFEVIDKLNDENLKGVFHCFTGDLSQAKHIINYGNFKLGIGGIITFKNTNFENIFTNISLDHVILETDSPYLAPTPYRGKRNESSYIPLIAKKLSELYGMSLEEIACTTTQNAKNLFKI